MNDNNPLSEAGTADEISAPRGDAPAALAAAEAKASDNWNSYLRAVAELENYRKRADRELENARKYAVERFAQELVGVVDSLEAGINAGTAGSGSALLEGTTATLKQLQRAFDKAGIKVIDPMDSPSTLLGMRRWWPKRAATSRPIPCCRSFRRAIP